MKNIGIMGLGVISSLGNDPETIWDNIGSEFSYDCNYDFKCNLPLSVKRRSDRFSKLYAYAMDEALKNSKINIEECNLNRVGTIFSSQIGPLKTNLSFCEEVLAGEPDECSPMKFSNTVSNACLGTLCKQYGTKGVSTMLLGSNSIVYSVDLLQENKADYIFTGYAEEYNEDYFNAFHKLKGMEDVKLTENAVTFLLGNSLTNKCICDIIRIKEINLGRNLLVFENEKTSSDKELIKHCIDKCIQDINIDEIDAALITTEENGVGKNEVQVLSECLSQRKVASNLREIIGFSAGSSLNTNIMLAVLCMKNGVLKSQLTKNKVEIPINNCILVTGYDISGNYTAVLLKKRDSNE